MALRQLVEIRDIIAASVDGETAFVTDRWDILPMRFDRFLFVLFYTFSAEHSIIASIPATLHTCMCGNLGRKYSSPRTVVSAAAAAAAAALRLRLLLLLLPAFDVLVCAVARAFSAVVDRWGILPVGFDRFLGFVLYYTCSAEHFIVASIQTTRHAEVTRV